MTNYKNDLPLYAEQITVNQEVEQIQAILSQFKQLVPEGFIELGQPKKYWGSTDGLDKTLCERYTFKYDNKSYTLDISQELSDKLKLTPKDNFCVKEEVLSRSLEEGGITINNEEELFLKKPFTIDNLEKDIKGYYNKIKELKEEKGKLERESKEIKINKKYWENEYRNERKKSKELEEKLKNIRQELEKEKGWWDKWINSDWPTYEINFPLETFSELTLPTSYGYGSYNVNFFKGGVISEASGDGKKNSRKIVKFIYQYYRDK